MYRILRDKIDNEAKTLLWVDKKKWRIRHTQPGYPGRIAVRESGGVLLAETEDHTPRIVGAFVGLLSSWFAGEISTINIQVHDEEKPGKKAKKK